MIFNDKKYTNWMKQANYTFNSALNDQKNNDFSWCCFKCQQAVEFGCKAFIFGLGLPSFGHSVKKLAEIIHNNVPLIEFNVGCLNELERYYIPTRYADAYDDGSPYTFYSNEDAEKAIKCAENIINSLEYHATLIINKENEEKLKENEEKITNKEEE
jgi:HEPN domain-containing protein